MGRIPGIASPASAIVMPNHRPAFSWRKQCGDDERLKNPHGLTVAFRPARVSIVA
jgi:hypothetical protein